MGSSTNNNGSWRLSPLPADWSTLRLAVLTRDRWLCQEVRHRGRVCLLPATEVDHIDGHDDHRMENLRALCHVCHGRKTQADNMDARKARTTRGREVHPFA